MGAAMLKLETTTTTEPVEYRGSGTCRVTGEPFVRSLSFRDRTPPKPDEAPVQVSSGFYFDDERPECRVHSVDFTTGPGQPLMVTLYVDPEYVAAPFEDKDGVIAPPAIAGRIFLVPPLDECPWEVVELPDPNNAAVVEEWVRCTVYVASVEVR